MKSFKSTFFWTSRLTTPFDIYETLRDVLDMRRSETPVTFKERGISLLKEIPINRTCASAGIFILRDTCRIFTDSHSYQIMNLFTKGAWTHF